MNRPIAETSLTNRSRRVHIGLTAAQRRRAARQIAAIGLLCLCGAMIMRLVRWLSGSNRHDLTVLLAVLVPVLLLGLMPLARRRQRQQRTAELARAGAICGACEYPMQGLDDRIARCPECGQPRAGTGVEPLIETSIV